MSTPRKKPPASPKPAGTQLVPRPAEAPPEIDLDTERFYSLQKMYEAEMEKENPNEMKLDRLEAQLEKVQQAKRQKTA